LNGARGVNLLSGGAETAIIMARKTGASNTIVDLNGNRSRNGVVLANAIIEKNPIARKTAALGVPSVIV
jgi:hypothetical protein